MNFFRFLRKLFWLNYTLFLLLFISYFYILFDFLIHYLFLFRFFFKRIQYWNILLSYHKRFDIRLLLNYTFQITAIMLMKTLDQMIQKWARTWNILANQLNCLEMVYFAKKLLLYEEVLIYTIFYILLYYILHHFQK